MAGGGPITVREYASAQENREHAAEVRRRLFAGPSREAERSPAPFIPPRPAKPSDFVSVPQPRDDGTYPIRALIRLCAEASGISEIDIRSQRRSRDVAKARFIAYWLARRFTLLSLPQIGWQIGGRDHTTVMNGHRRVEGIIADAQVRFTSCPKIMAERLWSLDWLKVPRPC